jgi:hypothetical protein
MIIKDIKLKVRDPVYLILEILIGICLPSYIIVTMLKDIDANIEAAMPPWKFISQASSSQNYMISALFVTFFQTGNSVILSMVNDKITGQKEMLRI